jgi:hypothetical protein
MSGARNTYPPSATLNVGTVTFQIPFHAQDPEVSVERVERRRRRTQRFQYRIGV